MFHFTTQVKFTSRPAVRLLSPALSNLPATIIVSSACFRSSSSNDIEENDDDYSDYGDYNDDCDRLIQQRKQAID